MRVGSSPLRIHVEELPGPGPFEVNLDSLVLRDDPDNLSVLAIVTAEGYIAASAWCQLADEAGAAEDGPRVYEADLVPTPVLRTLRGRVLTQAGTPAARSWVAFLPGALEQPVEYMVLSSIHCEPDGRFELRLNHAVPGGLLFIAPQQAVGREPIDSSARGDLDLGDVELPKGASISGRALRDGTPLPEGSVVLGSLPYRSSPWTLGTRGMIALEESAAFQQVETRVDADGRFELHGLEPGLEYRLAAVPARGSEGAGHLGTRGTPGTRIVAPADGVELDWGLLPVQVAVQAEGDPVARPRVRPVPARDDPRAVLVGIWRYGFQQPILGDEQGLLTLLVDPLEPSHLEVSAAGYETTQVDIDPKALPESGPIIVNLEGGSEPCTLRVKLDFDGSSDLNGSLAFLSLFDFSNGIDRKGPVVIRDGVAVFERVLPSCRQGGLTVHVPQTVDFDALPFAQLGNVSLQFPNLQPGETREVTASFATGGRIELSLVGRDPLLDPPRFELVEGTGNTVRPRIVRRDPRGHDTARAIETDGPYFLGQSLPVARYTVRQVGAAYATSEQHVEVRAGETSRITVQLESR